MNCAQTHGEEFLSADNNKAEVVGWLWKSESLTLVYYYYKFVSSLLQSITTSLVQRVLFLRKVVGLENGTRSKEIGAIE